MIEFIKHLFGLSRTFGMARSSEWEKFRNEFMKDNNFCEVCRTDKNLEAHHIKPFHLNPSLELDKDNLIALCRDHHYLFGHFLNWSSFNPDVISDSKIWNVKIKTRL